MFPIMRKRSYQFTVTLLTLSSAEAICHFREAVLASLWLQRQNRRFLRMVLESISFWCPTRLSLSCMFFPFRKKRDSKRTLACRPRRYGTWQRRRDRALCDYEREYLRFMCQLHLLSLSSGGRMFTSLLFWFSMRLYSQPSPTY